jgi:membrane-bound lytic murein transglycosylase D
MHLIVKACRARIAPLLCACLLSAGLAQGQTYPPDAPLGVTADPAATPQGNGLQPLTPQTSAPQTVAPLATTTDLWERIRRGYAMPDLDSPLVRDRETWYTARPDYIFRMTERSRKYLFHIVEELELRNMPTELALLPFVESAFNPQAVSSAKAAGMWQFMPATGRTFELKQNVFRDDRRDVLASTRAALDYLQKLYGMFGDWHLALAAYNWGEGSVGRAIAKNERLMLGTGYTDLTMPMETQFYVPKLQAIKNIVARPQAFSSDLPKIGHHPYFQTVNIRRDMDITLAAKMAEVPLDDFKALNPSLNKPVILAAGTPQILLPWDSADVFLQNLDRLAGSRLASWTVWVAPSTLRVADAAKQFGMSEAQLRELNNIPKGMLIKPGSALLVTRATHSAPEVTEAVADRGEVSFAPEIVQVRKTVRAAKGDSVASIAKRYATTPGNVAQWNKVAANASFKAGQSVVVYVSASAAKARAKPKASGAAKGKTTKRPVVKKTRVAGVKKQKA